MPKAFYRRQLPHLQRDNKPHFLTFCTHHRWTLPDHVRSTVLDCCLRHEGTKIDLQVALVMPDHVHLIFTLLVNEEAMEVRPLAEITEAIKGASAHKINQALGRKGHVWQAESFDHVLRSSESLEQKVQYLLENPVRQTLVSRSPTIPGFGTSHSRIPTLQRFSNDELNHAELCSAGRLSPRSLNSANLIRRKCAPLPSWAWAVPNGT
jgi:REP element-mobilizing transposase RayT